MYNSRNSLAGQLAGAEADIFGTQGGMYSADQALRGSLANASVNLATGTMDAQNNANRNMIAADQLGLDANDSNFNNWLASSQFGLDAANQNNTWNQSAADFYNTTLGQEWEMNNTAQQAEFMQNMAAAQFYNQAQGANTTYANDIAQQTYGNEMAALQYNNDLAVQNANYQNAMRDTQISESLLERQMPINEIAGLLGLTGVQMPQFPSYQAVPIQAPDVSGNVYKTAQLDMQGYQAQLQAEAANNSAMWGALGTLGAGFFKFSDRRVKHDIARYGRDEKSGLPLYSFRYNWDSELDPKRIGYMADEVAQVYPDLVFEIAGVLAIKADERLPYVNEVYYG
jgi:hypothetical protein